MKKSIVLSAVLCLTPWLASAQQENQEEFNREEGKSRRIVIFQPGTSDDAKRTAVESAGGQVKKHLGRINAVAAHVPEGSEGNLKSHPSILRVDEDLVVEAFVVKDSVKEDRAEEHGKPGGAYVQPVQETPWGISRVKAPEAWAMSQGAGVKVCVVDTGIDLDHPDLQTNIVGSFNAITPTKSADDDNGHGTHVAGTIAGLNNAIGVVGVAPQAQLLAVKVLSRTGSGWLSDIIEGLDWCANNGGKVANLSLGSSSDSQSFHDAVTAAVNAGVTVVAAAGNSGPCANCVGYPARYPEAIAVAAANSSDQAASFSSQGPEVDVIAPGKDVRSTYKGGVYAVMSGTSMATPHVSAAAALKLAQNSALTPAALADALKTNADLLTGLTAEQQGSGMINCQRLLSTP